MGGILSQWPRPGYYNASSLQLCRQKMVWLLYTGLVPLNVTAASLILSMEIFIDLITGYWIVNVGRDLRLLVLFQILGNRKRNICTKIPRGQFYKEILRSSHCASIMHDVS